MIRTSFTFLIAALLLSACGALPSPPTALPADPAVPGTLTPTPFQPGDEPALPDEWEPTPVLDYPAEGYGPQDFPPDINPLTGLQVTDLSLLERRPVIIKVSNLPRGNRPQWGLSLADIVYEYYTEEGSTRFAAVFHGQDTEQAGPIRSARLFDTHLIRMYKAVFAFGSADERVRTRLYSSGFSERLVLEWQAGCPALCIFEPQGARHLLGNTRELSAYLTRRGVPNGRQNLDGSFFQTQAPEGGQLAPQVFIRYSAAIYNRWDYDPASGRYLRFSDTQNDLSGNNEVYAQLTDRVNGRQLAADNVVVLFIQHDYFLRQPEIIDILATGSGKAYAFRDGQMYTLRWERQIPDTPFLLKTEDGGPFPLKPGATWFQVLGAASDLRQVDTGFRFHFRIP
jgi:hypothetical protein